MQEEHCYNGKIEMFVSYSHKDRKVKDQLVESLNPLRTLYPNLTIWHDGEINAGSDINEEIKNHLNSSDVVLLLVSTSYLNSYYCMEKELTAAIERMHRGDCVVIPVILSECQLTSVHPFYNLEYVPRDGRTISSYHNINKGCNEAAGMIRVFLKNFVMKKHDEIAAKDLSKKASNAEKSKSQHGKTRPSRASDVHILLRKDGYDLEGVNITQYFISRLPAYIRHVENFDDMARKSLEAAVRRFESAKQVVAYIDMDKFEAAELRIFLADLCSYTKGYVTGEKGFRVHFRGLCDNEYVGIVACTRNSFDDDGVELSTKITPIPAGMGLIHASQECGAPLLKSMNIDVNYETRHNDDWPEYLTYAINGLSDGEDAIMSFGVSVYKSYFEEKKDAVKTLFYQMAYMGFAEKVAHYVRNYCEKCKKIEKSYDIRSIIQTQFKRTDGVQELDKK